MTIITNIGKKFKSTNNNNNNNNLSTSRTAERQSMLAVKKPNKFSN